MKYLTLAIIFVLALVSTDFAQSYKRSIAITIDDLPVVSTRRDLKNRQDITRKLISHIRNAKIPAIGFVNENKLYTNGVRDEQQVDLLRLWLDAGLELGNHTFSHRSADAIDLKAYEDDILRGEIITKELLRSKGLSIKFFRHPFLQTGADMTVKNAIYQFLSDHNYTVAPITFDNEDYVFSRAYDLAFDSGDTKLMKQIGDAYVPYMEKKLDYWERQSRKLLGREISQTMLIHANFINSDYLDDLAVMLKKRGYKLVSLTEALKDEAYRQPDRFTRRAGISWLHRWALEKGTDMLEPGEPDTPEFVRTASKLASE